MIEKSKHNLSEYFRQGLKAISLLDAQFEPDQKKIQGLEARLYQERFHLAILGQFKRGKSTLLNALIGAEILPSSVIPLTAIPTYLLWGEKSRVRVHYLDQQPAAESTFTQVDELGSFLSRFVTEAENPKNQKGVAYVEVFYPSMFLRKGVVLMDTPGIGSTFRHNTEATVKVLSECDAALFLISADPPITEVEVDFLKSVKAKVGRLFFLINKMDYLTDQERNTVVSFFQSVLRDQVGINEPQIFCVSARQGLEAKKVQDTALWMQSGMNQVSDHLIGFLAKEKTQILIEALARKAYDIVSDVLMRLNLGLRSLEMPLAELDKRLKIFDSKLKETKQQRVFVSDLLTGEKKRTEHFLEEQAEELRSKSRNEINKLVQDCLKSMGNDINQTKVQEKLDEYIPRFFEQELGEMARVFDKKVTEVLGGYQQRADALIEAIRKTAAELFDVPYYAPSPAGVFKMNYLPYWVTQKITSTMSPLPKNLVNRLLPSKIRKAQIAKQYHNQVEALVLNNVENLRWATLQNLHQAFWKFSADLDERLEETISATHGAIKAAYEKRRLHSRMVAAEVEKIQTALKTLRDVQESLRTLF